MSDIKTVGNYEIGPAIWDADLETWCIRAGVKSRTGSLIIHITAHGKSPEVAKNRAEAYCLLMTAMRPPES